MNKKNVVILLHGLGANGIDTLFSNLSEYWNYKEVNITYFLAVDQGKEQFWESKVLENGVKVIHVTDLDGKKLYKWPRKLYRYLKKYGPFDAIHVNMDMLNGINLIIAKCAGIKKRVCHAHCSSNNKANSFVKQIFKDIYIYIMRFSIRILATDKIGCSDLAAEYFFGSGSYKILFNGINLKSNTGKEIRRKVDKNSPIFITVGRITVIKNPIFIIEIMQELIKRKPDVTLLWIGTGDMEKQVREKVTQYGLNENIEFLGIRNDVSDILMKADYFLLPSIFEGLSLALAEAQAVGLNCFVSDTVSALSDCGGCIFLPLEKGAAYWADEICTYIDEGEYKVIDAEKLSQFDIQKMAEELEKIYIS